MNSEKVKEIKKSLQQEIHLTEYVDSAYSENVSLDLLKDVLTLINELESENEKLNKALVVNLDAYRDGFTDGANLNNKVENKWKEENQRLKDKVTELESENEKLKIVVDIAKYRQRRL